MRQLMPGVWLLGFSLKKGAPFLRCPINILTEFSIVPFKKRYVVINCQIPGMLTFFTREYMSASIFTGTTFLCFIHISWFRIS